MRLTRSSLSKMVWVCNVGRFSVLICSMKPTLKFFARIVLTAALLIVTIVNAGAQPKPQNASLLFNGMSNLVSSTVATFTLSNGSPAHIACIPQATEYQTNQTWARVSLMGNSQRLTRKWMGVPEELLPGKAALFMVPPPYTNC